MEALSCFVFFSWFLSPAFPYSVLHRAGLVIAGTFGKNYFIQLFYTNSSTYRDLQIQKRSNLLGIRRCVCIPFCRRSWSRDRAIAIEDRSCQFPKIEYPSWWYRDHTPKRFGPPDRSWVPIALSVGWVCSLKWFFNDRGVSVLPSIRQVGWKSWEIRAWRRRLIINYLWMLPGLPSLFKRIS